MNKIKHIIFLATFLFVYSYTYTQVFYMDSISNLTTVNTCSAVIYDNGGNADYLNNTNVTRTFCSTDGGPIRLNFNYLNLELGYDLLYIYDGPTVGSLIIDTLTGSDLNNPAMFYTSTSTCLTLQFTTDNNVQQNSGADGGFIAHVGCAPQSCNGNLPIADDCQNATQICTTNEYCGTNNGWYTIDAQYTDTYIGNSQFCGSIENNSWLKFIADSTDVSLRIELTNCINTNGFQLVLFEGNCDSLTQVGTYCWNSISSGLNTFNFNGLTKGKHYYLMLDGHAGNICEYTIKMLSGIKIDKIDIVDAKGNSDSAYYCLSECGTFTVTTSLANSGYSPSFTWYSIPAGVSGSDSILNFCPTQDINLYCDIVGSCGTILTDSFLVRVNEVTFSGLPSTISCNDAPVSLSAPSTLSPSGNITPCIYIKLTGNSQGSPLPVLTIIEGGSPRGSITVPSGGTLTLTAAYSSPSDTISFQFTGNTGGDIPYSVYDCSNDSLIYSGFWTSSNGTQVISTPGDIKGIANYTSTCNSGLTSTDYGYATFDPSEVSGPFPQNCSVTYNWDNQNGCIGSYTKNIIVTSPNTSYTYIDNGNGNYTFTNNSSSVYNQYHWAFGDGYTSSTTNPTHTFSANGTYIVALTTNDSMGISCVGYYLDTIVVTGVIAPLQCVAGFVMYPDTVENNVIVVNSSTGTNLTYLWDFGDGDTSTLQTPTHFYATSDHYYLCLTIDDGAGCVDMYCDSIGQNGVVFNKQTGFTINVIAPPLATQIDEQVAITSGVAIYPNPTTAEFMIELANYSPRTQLSIVSIEGKTVYTNNNINTNKVVINAADWNKGIYVVKITDEKSSQVLKLIKQ
ncbi:MAG: T9SS type A sorting domain-containing protein [Flavobacteriales bacterium]|nr:T9SS type A sorting domain-containing protein [Flavobacteriales bacterium]